MTFVEFMEREAANLHKWLHEGDLSQRVWECRPLLVVDEETEVDQYLGDTKVLVTPHEDGTADLLAESDRDGWRPSLLSASVSAGKFGGYVRGQPPGLVCKGRDKDGFGFVWYINDFAHAHLTDEYYQSPPVQAEQPEPEDTSEEDVHKPKHR